MRSLKLVVFLGMGNDIRDCPLLIEALLIDSIFSKVGFNDVKLTQMPAALTLLADTVGGVVMAEIRLGKLSRSPIEGVLVVETLFVVVSGGIQGTSFRRLSKGHLLDLVGLAFHSRFHFGLKGRFGLRGRR